MISKLLITFELAALLLIIADLAMSRKYKLAVLFIIPFFATYYYSTSVIKYFSGLGTDSYLELQSFDVNEAIGYLSTIQSVLVAQPVSYSARSYVILAFFLASVSYTHLTLPTKA